MITESRAPLPGQARSTLVLWVFPGRQKKNLAPETVLCVPVRCDDARLASRIFCAPAGRQLTILECIKKAVPARSLFPMQLTAAWPCFAPARRSAGRYVRARRGTAERRHVPAVPPASSPVNVDRFLSPSVMDPGQTAAQGGAGPAHIVFFGFGPCGTLSGLYRNLGSKPARTSFPDRSARSTFQPSSMTMGASPLSKPMTGGMSMGRPPPWLLK